MPQVDSHSASRSLLPRLAALVLLLSLASGRAEAHPHVWIDATVNLVFKDKKIEAMNITWVFDEVYSGATIADFGKHQKASMDQSELKGLVELSTKSLRNYSYFTYLQIDGKRRRVDSVKDFTAEVKGGRLIYHFTVTVSPPVDPLKQRFEFLLFDETYYVYVGLLAKGKGVTFSGDAPDICTDSRKQDLTTPLYFGYDYPTLVHVACE